MFLSRLVCGTRHKLTCYCQMYWLISNWRWFGYCTNDSKKCANVEAYKCFCFYWYYSPKWAQAAPLLRFLDPTQLDTHLVGLLWMRDQFVAEAATYTTHNRHRRSRAICSAVFEAAIPATERPQTYASKRTTKGIGILHVSLVVWR